MLVDLLNLIKSINIFWPNVNRSIRKVNRSIKKMVLTDSWWTFMNTHGQFMNKTVNVHEHWMSKFYSKVSLFTDCIWTYMNIHL